MMDEDEENYLPETQTIDDRVLKDVVAYVEVRCGFENRSKGVSKQLEILGAKISGRLTKEVTHVIWKDGKGSTHERALKWGIHVLSVLWVDSCRQNQEHVAESLFQVKTGDDGSPIIGKLKRLKSMQPKHIEDQVKKSAEKFAKRQKKKANQAGSIQRPYVFTADTQNPYSPLAIEPRLSTPTTIADTPNSMRCALEALDRAKKLGVHETLDSPVHGERSIPLHKRLFSVTASSDDVSDYRSSPVKSTLHRRTVSIHEADMTVEEKPGKKSDNRKSEAKSMRRKTLISCAGVKQAAATQRSSRRSSVMKESRLFDDESQVEMGHFSESSRNSSPVFSKNSADTVFEFVSEKMTPEKNVVHQSRLEKNNIQNNLGKVSSKSTAKRTAVSVSGILHRSDISINADDKQGNQMSGKRNIKATAHKRKRSAGKTGKTCDDNNTSSSSSNENNKKIKKRRLLTVHDFGTPPVQLVEPSRSSASDSAGSSCEHHQRNKDPISKKNKRDGKKTNTTILPIKGLRNSLEDFNFKRRNKRQRSKKTTSVTSGSSSSHSSIMSFEEKYAESNEVAENLKLRQSSKEKAKRTLCMTSLSPSDQGIVISIIRKLGQFDVVDAVCDSTTHVILGQDRRTLNVLAAIARGCWLLSIEWVFKSLEEGCWLPEEPFEQHELYPIAQLSRLEHCASEGTYKTDLFSSFSPLFIGDDTIAPPDRIQELVEWCGGHVCSSTRVARLAIGKTQPRTNLKTVDEKWVYDCINQLQTCPLKNYSMMP